MEIKSSAQLTSESEKQLLPAWKYLFHQCWLCLALLFPFGAFVALQNIEAGLSYSDTLGMTSLAILYIAFSITCPAAPLIVSKFGTKRTLVFGINGYAIFVAAHFAPSAWTLYPGAFMVGCGGALVWCAAGVFTWLGARNYSKALGLADANAHMGLFYGIMGSAFQIFGVVGNFVASQILDVGKKEEGGKVNAEELDRAVFLLVTIFFSSAVRSFLPSSSSSLSLLLLTASFLALWSHLDVFPSRSRPQTQSSSPVVS
jgi:MFS family permease